jgi:diphosphomevalonate decarboxylase
MTATTPTAATVLAHPNIALIKYWGKRPGTLNLPAVGSLSITLDTLATQTQVELVPSAEQDAFFIGGAPAPADQAVRAAAFMHLVRAMVGDSALPYASINSSNNFPTGAGLASSASGFAALALAATRAYGLSCSPAVLSRLARQGSGSAARSIFGGFVQMAKGVRDDGMDAVAAPLLPAAAWPLRVVVAITHRGVKAVGSTAGMERTRKTSPYWDAWVKSQEADLAEGRQAVLAHDFAGLADIAEHSCFKMHALAMSARPHLVYALPGTLGAQHRVAALRQDGVPVFCTMDAGPQVKAVCLPEAEQHVVQALKEVPGVVHVMTAGLGAGARVVGATS